MSQLLLVDLDAADDEHEKFLVALRSPLDRHFAVGIGERGQPREDEYVLLMVRMVTDYEGENRTWWDCGEPVLCWRNVVVLMMELKRESGRPSRARFHQMRSSGCFVVGTDDNNGFTCLL